MKSGNGKLLVCTGNANPTLAKNICKYLDIGLGEMSVARFSEGEIKVNIKQNVRGCDVFIIQPTCPPVNENLMELLIIIDALKRASANRITAVIPYYGYARQDRKDQPRVPITAKLVANLLTTAGASRVLTMDLHAAQIQGFFDIPVDNLYAIHVFESYFNSKPIKNRCVVSPDVGGIKAARAYAKQLKASLAIVDKRRRSDTEAEAMHILGEVKDKNIIIVDDIVATAGSLVEAVCALKKAGAKDIYAAISHAVLSGPAIERLKKSQIKELVVTDSIPIDASRMLPKIKVLTVAHLLGEAIKRTHFEESISGLFEQNVR